MMRRMSRKRTLRPQLLRRRRRKRTTRRPEGRNRIRRSCPLARRDAQGPKVKRGKRGLGIVAAVDGLVERRTRIAVADVTGGLLNLVER